MAAGGGAERGTPPSSGPPRSAALMCLLFGLTHYLFPFKIQSTFAMDSDFLANRRGNVILFFIRLLRKEHFNLCTPSTTCSRVLGAEVPGACI